MFFRAHLRAFFRLRAKRRYVASLAFVVGYQVVPVFVVYWPVVGWRLR